MKKKIFISIVGVISTILSVTDAYPKTSVFEFPILPGDGKWEKYESVSLRKEALQIPDSLLPQIPSYDLLQLCLNYPYNIDAYALDDIQEGFKRLYESFNGYMELFSRNDFPQTVIEEIDRIPALIEKVEKEDLLTQGMLSLRLRNFINMVISNDVLGKVEVPSGSISEKLHQATTATKNFPEISSMLNILESNSINDGIEDYEDRPIYYSVMIKLPNNVLTEALKLLEGEMTEAVKIAKKKEVETTYGVEVLREATYTYNCHAYAWYMYRVHDMDPVWLDYPDEYWQTGCYYEVSEEEADVVLYANDGAYTHSAVRIKSDEYISKWGRLPLVRHTPNNVLPGYGTPYKYYKKYTPVLNGPDSVEGSATYSIGFLPKDFRVEWSLSDEYYSQNCMRVNADGTCTITQQPAKGMNNATLTAKIYVNKILGWTLGKNISSSSDQELPTYDINGSSQTILNYPYIIYAKKGDAVHIHSSSFIKATVTYEGDVVPSRWIWDEYKGDLSIYLPFSTNGSAMVVHINCLDGTKYDIVLLIRDSRTALSINIEGDILTLSISETIFDLVSGDSDRADETSQTVLNTTSDDVWEVEITNALTGTLVYSGDMSQNELSIDISGWSPGIYVITMRHGEIILSEVIIIK